MKEKTFYWLLASKWLESRYERFLDRFSSPCVVMVVIYSWPCPRRRSTLWCRARQGDARTYPAQPLSSAPVEWINLSTGVIIRIICIISRVEGSTEFHFFHNIQKGHSLDYPFTLMGVWAQWVRLKLGCSSLWLTDSFNDFRFTLY